MKNPQAISLHHLFRKLSEVECSKNTVVRIANTITAISDIPKSIELATQLDQAVQPCKTEKEVLEAVQPFLIKEIPAIEDGQDVWTAFKVQERE